MQEILRFTIYGRPATAKNGNTPFFNRSTGKMMAFKKPSLVRWEKEAMRQLTGKHRLNIDFPVNVAVRVWTKENRKADLVGYLQAVDDFLTRGLVIKDDSGWNPRIVASHDGSTIVGVDKKDPRIEIVISRL